MNNFFLSYFEIYRYDVNVATYSSREYATLVELILRENFSIRTDAFIQQINFEHGLGTIISRVNFHRPQK